MEKNTNSNQISDETIMAWAETGIQLYSALLHEGLYPHSRFSAKVCLNEVGRTLASYLEGYYRIPSGESLATAEALLDRIRPAIIERIAKEEADFYSERTAERIASTAAAARSNA